MYVSSARSTAGKLTRMLGCAAGACLLLLGLCSSAASADDSLSSTAVKSVLAVCPNQTFSQPFIELGDANYYMQVSGPQGWELRGGAQVVQTTLPNGSSGAAVDLPSGSVAITPPVCVTLQYPTARVYTGAVEGQESVAVAVAYPNSSTQRRVAVISTEASGESSAEAPTWKLSEAFEIRPELGGTTEGTRKVRFIFKGQSGSGDAQVYGLNVDPWMR